MKTTIIIPTLNEAENIGRLIDRLKEKEDEELFEILVVDAGSSDNTIQIAQEKGAQTISSQKGRAVQMNLGAEKAKGDLLYFVHGDTLPPLSYMDAIQQAVREGFPIGCFRYQFDSSKKLLKINAFFTRFKMIWCRGGDQSLFITKELFLKMKGFRSDYQIMEDFEFIQRARKTYPFKIIPKNMLVSARKYENNSYMRVQIANLIVFNMFRFGYSQQSMVKMYRRLLADVKN